MPVIQQLSPEDVQVADREQWMLIKGGPGVLPEVRKLLGEKLPMCLGGRSRSWHGRKT